MNKSAWIGFAVTIMIFMACAAGYVGFKSLQTAQQATNLPPRAPQAMKPAVPPAPNAPITPPTQVRKEALQPASEDPNAKIAMVRELANGGTFQPGGTVDVTVTITKDGDKPVRAIGLIENLPDGWSFDSIVGGNPPDLSPPKGRTPTLEYAWFNIPEFPASFTYRVKAPASATAPVEITGQTLFRTDGPELRTPAASSVLAPGGPAVPAAETPAPAAPPADAAKAAPVPAAGAGFDLAQAASANAYTPGSPLEVQVSMNYGGADPVTALAVVETLPEGWTFGKVTGGTPPAVAPKEGAAGVVNFIWINIPAWPATFAYSVNVPQGVSGAQKISGQALYRTSGDQQQTGTIVTEINASGS